MAYQVPAQGLVHGLDMIEAKLLEIEAKLGEGEAQEARELSIWLRHRLTAVSAAMGLAETARTR